MFNKDGNRPSGYVRVRKDDAMRDAYNVLFRIRQNRLNMLTDITRLDFRFSKKFPFIEVEKVHPYDEKKAENILNNPHEYDFGIGDEESLVQILSGIHEMEAEKVISACKATDDDYLYLSTDVVHDLGIKARPRDP